MKHKSQGILVALVALLWLTLAVSLYYVGNKPFTPDVAAIYLLHFWRVLVAVLVLSVSGGMGKRAMDLTLGPLRRHLSGLALVSVEASLGLAILGTLILAIGGTLGITVWIVAILLILPGVVLTKDIFDWWMQWGALQDTWLKSGRFGKVIALGAGFILTLALFLSLAPPIKFDALVYHLAIPKIYLDIGRITYLPGIMYWGMPELGEMIYTLGMAMGGMPAATVLGWTFGALALMGISGYVKERFGTRAGWSTLASLLAGYTLVVSLSWGYVDWLAVLFGSSFLITLDLWRQRNDARFLVLTGLFAGSALGSKYTAGILLLAGIGVVAWQSRTEKSPAIKPLFLFLGIAFLASSAWWIKNLLATGNPIYPLLFPAGGMNTIRLDFYQNHPVQRAWYETLLLPFFVTWKGVEGGPGYGASIGPLLLSLSALAWLGWRDRSPIQRVAIGTAMIVVLIGFLSWALASRLSDLLTQTRLYFAMLPAWAVLAGAGFSALERLRLPQVRLERIGGAFILLVLWLNVFQVADHVVRAGVLQLLGGQKSAQAYLEDNLGWYVRAMQAIQDLPGEVHVLTLYEPRSLYCQPRCQPDEILDRWVTAIRRSGEPSLVLSNWQAEGYTHLLYNRSGAEFIREDDPRYDPAEWQALDELLSLLAPPVDIGGGYELYTLNP
jgi:hypothetical protein